MMKITYKSIVVYAAILFVTAAAVRAQPKPESLFNPPSWIWGEWRNFGDSNEVNIERIVFSAQEIELSQALADTGVPFSRKFKKYQVKESGESDTYKLVISKDKEEYIYEFKLCPADECHLNIGDALTYSVTKNKKVIRPHLTSVKNVLIRRTRVAAISPNTAIFPTAR